MKRAIAGLFLIFLLFTVISCGGASGDAESAGSSVRVILQFPDESTQTRVTQTTPRQSAEDLETVEITVNGDFSTIQRTFNISSLPFQGTLPVPTGSGIEFTIIGRDAGGQPICRGDAIVDIFPGTNTVTIPCNFVHETCNDGSDNDGDGLTDCSDLTDCEGSRCDTENEDLICIEGSCSVRPTPTPSVTPTPSIPPPINEPVCTDGVDNDNDGETDCDDFDCNGDPCLIDNIQGTCVNFECSLVPQNGTILGLVSNAAHETPIPGAAVTVLQGQAHIANATTNASGSYSIQGLPPGVYTVTVSAPGFLDESRPVQVIGGQSISVNFSLTPIAYYAFDPTGTVLQLELTGWADNTTYTVIDLDSNMPITGGTLNKFDVTVPVSSGLGHFKVEASKPLLAHAVEAFSGLQDGSYFFPTLDGRSFTGRNFIIRIPALSGTSEFNIFAYEDSEVTFRDTDGNIITTQTIPADGFFATIGSPLAENVVYQVESTGNISIMINAINGNTTAPSSNGTDIGREFLVATYLYDRSAVAVFAYENATVTGTDLVTDVQEFSTMLSAGQFDFISDTVPNKYKIESTGNIAVWTGSTEKFPAPPGNSIEYMGDDLTLNTGDEGREFFIHTQLQGVIFATQDNTAVEIDGDFGLSASLDEGEFLDLNSPQLGFIHIVSDKPILVQTRGGDTFNDVGKVLRLAPK